MTRTIHIGEIAEQANVDAADAYAVLRSLIRNTEDLSWGDVRANAAFIEAQDAFCEAREAAARGGDTA